MRHPPSPARETEEVAIDLVASGLLALLPFAVSGLSGMTQVSFLARLAAAYPSLAVEFGREPSGRGAIVDRLTVRQWWVTPRGLRGEGQLTARATIARAARALWWGGLFVWPGVSVGLSLLMGADLVVGLALIPAWTLTGPLAIRHVTTTQLPAPEAAGNASGNAAAFYALPGLVIGAVVLALALGWVVGEFRG